MQQKEATPEKKPSAICFVNTTRDWGGGEKWHFEMATMLQEKGYAVFTITARGSALQKKLLEGKIPNATFNISNISFLNPFTIKKLKAYFTRNSIDAVIMNLPSDLKTAGPAAKKAGVSKIIYRRGSAIPVKNSWLNRYLYRRIADLVLVNSRATKNTILEKNEKLIPHDKIKILYNGLHLENYSYTKKSRQQSAPIVIGNLGRFVKQKGQQRFIDIAGKLKEREIPFKIILGGEGKLKKEIQQKIRTKGLESFFELPGFIADTSRFMQQLDIFVLTSYWEGFGYVLAEAMACGKPVIGFNISSNPELIRDRQNGFLIENDDLDALTDRIEYLYRQPSEIDRMAREGRKIAEQEFEIASVTNHLIHIIDQ